MKDSEGKTGFREILKTTTIPDWLVFVLLLFISLSGLITVKKLIPQGNTVIVESEGKVAYKLSLLKDQRVEVKGPIGFTIVEIKNHKVRVIDSPCPKKYCVLQGWKDRGAIVCLPNRVVVRIGGEDGSGVDAITG